MTKKVVPGRPHMRSDRAHIREDKKSVTMDATGKWIIKPGRKDSKEGKYRRFPGYIKVPKVEGVKTADARPLNPTSGKPFKERVKAGRKSPNVTSTDNTRK